MGEPILVIIPLVFVLGMSTLTGNNNEILYNKKNSPISASERAPNREGGSKAKAISSEASVVLMKSPVVERKIPVQ